MFPPEHVRAEIAVIGSGPGGSVTAAMLAEAGRDVVLIEEGPNLPLDGYEPYSRQEMADKYRNGGLTVAMGRPNVTYVEACCVGGGSEINSGLYHRTPAEVLRAWTLEPLRRSSMKLRSSPLTAWHWNGGGPNGSSPKYLTRIGVIGYLPFWTCGHRSTCSPSTTTNP